jgi:VWFA-related protein
MLSGRPRGSWLPVALLLAAGVSSAFAGKEIHERVTVSSVEVPVQVSLDGQPLRGLTADQFLLKDNGKKQRITGFRAVDLALLRQEIEGETYTPIPIAARRHFLIVFDLSFADPGTLLRARQQMRTWLEGSLHPADLVAVATFSVAAGPELLLNFTADLEQILLAVETLGHPELVNRSDDPLSLEFGRATRSMWDDTEFKGLLDGSGLAWDDDALRGAMRDIYFGSYEPLHDQQKRQPIHRLSRSFAGLARMMAGAKGRKYVIYLSEGFDSSLVFADDDMESVKNMNQWVVDGAIWRVDAARRFGSGSTQAALLGMLEEFRKADCVIHAVDLRPLRGAEGGRYAPSSADGLMLMAGETGGELYRSFSDLSKALDKIFRDTSLTYLLSFNPRSLKPDGSYHRLKVKLQDAPAKARVTHRPGYYAPSPPSQRSAQQHRIAAGQLIIEGREGGPIPTALLAGPVSLDDRSAYVPVWLEIDGPALLAGNASPRLVAEIYAYAFDVTGRLADFFTQTVNLDRAAAAPALAGGLKFYGELDLPPGEYSLRTLVINRGTARTGMRVARLRVPALGPNEPFLLPPLFPEPPGRWLLAREARLEQEENRRPFPFLFRDEPFVPAARPRLPAGAVSPLYLLARGLSAELATVGASLYALDGQEVRRVELPVERRAPGFARDWTVLVVLLDAQEITPGEYTLVVELTDTATGASGSASIALAVDGE